MKKRPLIYLIEDDDAVRDALGRFLETEGYDTKGFASSGCFLAALNNADQPPDCIISDLRVPDAEGGNMLNVLKTLKPTIPIVVLSADPGLLHSHPLADRLGERCLRKPASAEALIQAVRSALTEA